MDDSNTNAESSSGRRLTSGAQDTTSIDADRTVFTDRDGRELSLIRVADGAELPVLGYTERAIAWGTCPTEAATAAGHISIDVSGYLPDARLHPRADGGEGLANTLPLTPQIVDPGLAGYPDAPFVVRLQVEGVSMHSVAGAVDLVYHSLEADLQPDGGYTGATDEEVREAIEAAEEEDSWKPEPLSLREGETRDDMGHAARNLEMLDQGLEDGLIAPEDISEDQRDQLGIDESGEEETPVLVTDGGRTRCIECGAFIPDEIDDGTGVYCPQCGTGQHVTDGGRDVAEAGSEMEVLPVYALDTSDPDLDIEGDQVVAHGMDQECVRAWGLEAFVVDRESPFWNDDLDGLAPGETVALEADSYDDVAPVYPDEELVTDGGRVVEERTDGVLGALRRLSNRLLGDRSPQTGSYQAERMTRRVSDGGLTTAVGEQGTDPAVGESPDQPELAVEDEVYDRDREYYGEVREVVPDAYVGGGRTVDRLRIRWDPGVDEWFHRTWIRCDAGRRIVPVVRGDDSESGMEGENVNA